MSRFAEIQSYFIKYFFQTLEADPEFANLRHPAELFDSQGTFILPPDVSGFARLPSLARLKSRILASRDAQEISDLQHFVNALGHALQTLCNGMAAWTSNEVAAFAQGFAPVIRHPDSQRFWPIDMKTYLSMNNSSLKSAFCSKDGEKPLSSNIFALMFDNPDIVDLLEPAPPYVVRRPFVTTVGLKSPRSNYPATPLQVGQLNLAAADNSLTAEYCAPVLYAEMKQLGAALRNNAAYLKASASFPVLQNNRVQRDPSWTPLTPIQLDSSLGQMVARARAELEKAALLVYHAFYPVDDEAKRRPSPNATNREFHHLAVGLLFPVLPSPGTLPQDVAATASLLMARAPNRASMYPLLHPSVQLRDNSGNPSPLGTHPVIFSVLQSPSGYDTADADTSPTEQAIESAVEKDAPIGTRLEGAAIAAAIGAAAGSPAGPIGALIGAAIAIVVFILISLVCALFGCGDESTDDIAWAAYHPYRPSSDSFEQSVKRDLAPTGLASASGGNTLAQTVNIDLIPHSTDANLYGLQTQGDTFKVTDNQSLKLKLAWHAFPAGIGYQFDRKIPGRVEISGTSLRDYFTLFAEKAVEVRVAQQMVTYL